MSSPVPVVVESPRRFPAAVEEELRRRRADLGSALDGNILDLDQPEARTQVALASAGRRVERSYATVVSVGQLVRFPDLTAALRGIERLLGPGGTVLLVEPSNRPGLTPVLLDSAFARTRWTRGFHLGRDISAAFRATTFMLADLERFTMSTPVPSLRHGVEIHGRKVAETTTSPDSNSEVMA